MFIWKWVRSDMTEVGALGCAIKFIQVHILETETIMEFSLSAFEVSPKWSQPIWPLPPPPPRDN